MSVRGLRFALACLVASYAFLGAVILAGYQFFPGPLATHFGADEQPDGWMTREECVKFLVSVGLIGPGIIVATVFILTLKPVLHFKWIGRRVEIPRDRAEEVRLFLRRMGLGFASLIVLFISGAQISILISNAGTAPIHLNRLVFGAVLFFFILGNAQIIRRVINYFRALARENFSPAEPTRFSI